MDGSKTSEKLPLASTPYLSGILVVADSTFRCVSIDLEEIGELQVLLPWTIDYPEEPASWHVVSWECFGMGAGVS